MDISRLTTESRNEHSSKLDTLTPEQFVDVMNNEDQKVAQFIKEENHAIAQLITQGIKQWWKINLYGRRYKWSIRCIRRS